MNRQTLQTLRIRPTQVLIRGLSPAASLEARVKWTQARMLQKHSVHPGSEHLLSLPQ